MKFTKNKKGFTLVELLAVIVILALIMSIAIVSMSGIMQGARQSTFKETAVQIINGVRDQLMLANELTTGEASTRNFTTGVDYYFTSDIIEKGGVDSPLGGKIKYIDATTASGTGYTKIGSMGIYRGPAGTCSATSNSFVHVTHNGTNFVYSICLTAGEGNKYIDSTLGTETALLGSDTNMILPQ